MININTNASPDYVYRSYGWDSNGHLVAYDQLGEVSISSLSPLYLNRRNKLKLLL